MKEEMELLNKIDDFQKEQDYSYLRMRDLLIDIASMYDSLVNQKIKNDIEEGDITLEEDSYGQQES